MMTTMREGRVLGTDDEAVETYNTGVAPGRVSLTQQLSSVQRRAADGVPPGEAVDAAEAVDGRGIQWMAAVQRIANPMPQAPDDDAVHRAAAHGISGSAGALPHLDRIQHSFGRHALSGVLAHTDDAAAAGARAMQAEAFAAGDRVAFAGAPTLFTAAHEAAHVVQQRGGVQLRGGVGAVGDPYERHADTVADKVVRGESAETLLDQMAGGGGGTAVQRLTQPIVSAAPATAMPIRRFIELVEAEEARYPGDEMKTSLMITRLRKLFYDSAGWNQHLIPGAAGIAPGRPTSMQTDRHDPLDLPGPINATIKRDHLVVSGNPDIARNQEVALEDGTFCDIGHVFAGLDASNHQQMVDGPALINVRNNVDAVTWVGDLASAVGEILFAMENNSGPISSTREQALVNEYASPQDMLGNIDAYAIRSAYGLGDNSGRRVSTILREFYLGAAGTRGGDARNHRYTRYCGQVGLNWSGGVFTNEADWVTRAAEDVSMATMLYIGASTESSIAAGLWMADAPQAVVRITLSRAVTQNYVNALRTLCAAEPP
jgi:hypothetical protein